MEDQTGLLEVARENRSSIELKRSAKGEYSYNLKTYYDEEQPGAARAALASISVVDAELRSLYCGDDPPESDDGPRLERVR